MVWSAVRSLGISCPLPSSELPANRFLSSRRRPLANRLHEIQWNDFAHPNGSCARIMVEDIANLVRPDRVPYQERTLPAQPALLEAREQLMQRIAFRLRRICRHSGFGSAQPPGQ